jgi:hypothetical protein
VIRFSAALVVVAIGLLGGGVVTNKLTLVYIAIAVSAGALIMLAIGVAFKRDEIFGDGYVLAPADAGASPVFSAPGQSAPSQPVSPFPASTVAPLAQSGFGADGGLADVARGAAGGGWDRTGHDRVGQRSFGERQEGLDQPDFGRSAKGRPAFGQNPARNPWPEPDEVSGGPGPEPASRQFGDAARPAAWAAPGSGPDGRSDQDRDSLPPWMASGSGQGTWSDRDRQADQVSGWQAGTLGGEPSGTDTSGYGGSRDSAGRPPLPGRHSRNAGADEPWSPPAPAEPSSKPESPSPFASAPRRVPGATLGNVPGATLGNVPGATLGNVPGATRGNWFDQPAESDRRSDAEAGPSPQAWDGKPWGGRVMGGESAVTPRNPAPDDAPEATSPSATASGSGWSSSGWSWSTPSPAPTDDPAPSGSAVVTGVPGDAVASASTTASSDDDEDWPTRYSWLEDDETDKPGDSADPPSGDADEVAKNDVKTPGDPEQHEASTVDAPTTTDADADADEPAAQTAATTASEIPESAVGDTSASDVIDETQEAEAANETASPEAAHESGTDHATGTGTGHGTGGNAGDAGPAAETADGAGLVTILPGVPRYHEANCILIRFMPQTDVQHLTIAAAEDLGCTPCTACQSEE